MSQLFNVIWTVHTSPFAAINLHPGDSEILATFSSLEGAERCAAEARKEPEVQKHDLRIIVRPATPDECVSPTGQWQGEATEWQVQALANSRLSA